MYMSMKHKLYSSLRTKSNASLPLHAMCTRNPARDRILRMYIWEMVQSSTTRMVPVGEHAISGGVDRQNNPVGDPTLPSDIPLIDGNFRKRMEGISTSVGVFCDTNASGILLVRTTLALVPISSRFAAMIFSQVKKRSFCRKGFERILHEDLWWIVEEREMGESTSTAGTCSSKHWERLKSVSTFCGHDTLHKARANFAPLWSITSASSADPQVTTFPAACESSNIRR
mmetsp:Transcript_38572/g.53569  ORF Transcript_38572/g.53569 Transcript_38572/m.53569 type:complete len:228 (+) Transcript_38572:1035-1718(+)